MGLIRGKVFQRVFPGRPDCFLFRRLGRSPIPAGVRDVGILSRGCALSGRFWVPQGGGAWPTVILVPGGGSPGRVHDQPGHAMHLRAVDIAGMGMCVLHYDPSGRGGSPGGEDHWGHVHQDELAEVIRFALGQPEVNPDNLGVMSFSIGLTIAAGCLARNKLPQVRYLLDWEGPSDRYTATKNDTHAALKAYPTNNEAFWCEREAVRFIRQIRCRYARYQARRDHVQGDRFEHALAIVNAAVSGVALEVRLNGQLVTEPLGFAAARSMLLDEVHNCSVVLAHMLRQCHGGARWDDEPAKCNSLFR